MRNGGRGDDYLLTYFTNNAEIEMLNKGMFTSKTDMRATPQDFFDNLNKEFRFTLDPCATPENAKCEKYFTVEDDGLSKSRDNENVFCNPPY